MRAMTASQVLKKTVAQINRYARVSYIAEEHGALGVPPSDRWWQSNAAARMQSGLWGALLLGERRSDYPSRLR